MSSDTKPQVDLLAPKDPVLLKILQQLETDNGKQVTDDECFNVALQSIVVFPNFLAKDRDKLERMKQSAESLLEIYDDISAGSKSLISRLTKIEDEVCISDCAEHADNNDTLEILLNFLAKDLDQLHSNYRKIFDRIGSSKGGRRPNELADRVALSIAEISVRLNGIDSLTIGTKPNNSDPSTKFCRVVNEAFRHLRINDGFIPPCTKAKRTLQKRA